jgi:hypothetical protein
MKNIYNLQSLKTVGRTINRRQFLQTTAATATTVIQFGFLYYFCGEMFYRCNQYMGKNIVLRDFSTYKSLKI